MQIRVPQRLFYLTCLAASLNSVVSQQKAAANEPNSRISFGLPGCPFGWRDETTAGIGEQYLCLKFFTELETFTGAQASCRQLKGFLVSLLDVPMNKLSLYKQYANGSSFWIGLHRMNNRFYWDGNNPTKISSFYSICPRNGADHGWGCRGIRDLSCASVRFTGKSNETLLEYKSSYCEQQLPYLCAVKYDYNYTFEPDPMCGNQWMYVSYNDVSYKYINNNYTFTDADQACGKENASLANVYSSNDVYLLRGFLSDRAPMSKIGLIITLNGSIHIADVSTRKRQLSLPVPQSLLLNSNNYCMTVATTSNVTLPISCSGLGTSICEKNCNQKTVVNLTFASNTSLLTCNYTSKTAKSVYWLRNGAYFQDNESNSSNSSFSVIAKAPLATYRCGVIDDQDRKQIIWSNDVIADNSKASRVSYRAIIYFNMEYDDALLEYALFDWKIDGSEPVIIQWVHTFHQILAETLCNVSLTSAKGSLKGGTMLCLLLECENSGNQSEISFLSQVVAAGVDKTNARSTIRGNDVVLLDSFYCHSSSLRNATFGAINSTRTLAGEWAFAELCGVKGKLFCSGRNGSGAHWDYDSWIIYELSADASCNNESVSQALQLINENVISTSDSVTVIKSLSRISQTASNFNEADVAAVANILNRSVNNALNGSFNSELVQIPQDIGRIISKTATIAPNISATTSSQITTSLEKSLLWLAQGLSADESTANKVNKSILTFNSDNLSFLVDLHSTTVGFKVEVNTTSDAKYFLNLLERGTANFDQRNSLLTLDANNKTLEQPKVFITYDSAKLFKGKTGERKASSRILSAQLVESSEHHYRHGIVVNITFRDLALQYQGSVENQTFACGFWNYSTSDWSVEGCSVISQDNYSISCQCNHLTNFAALLAVSTSENQQKHDLALNVISYVGLGISIIALAAVIISFLVFRDMRKTVSQKVLFNLSVSLISLDVVFVAGGNVSKETDGCFAIAALLHYFLLTSFAWMLVEAILQYQKFVKVIGTYIPKFMLKSSIPAWGIPALIVAIISSSKLDLYKNQNNQNCFVETLLLYYGIILPIAAIITVNTVIFIIVFKKVCCSKVSGRSPHSERKSSMLYAQAGVAICALLGLTWIFGFFQFPDSGDFGIVSQYLFCLLNSTQGLLIFIFHCAREKPLRDTWRRFCCPKKDGRLMRKNVNDRQKAGPQVSHELSDIHFDHSYLTGTSSLSMPLAKE